MLPRSMRHCIYFDRKKHLFTECINDFEMRVHLKFTARILLNLPPQHQVYQSIVI
jgi:hypothetical protein